MANLLDFYVINRYVKNVITETLKENPSFSLKWLGEVTGYSDKELEIYCRCPDHELPRDLKLFFEFLHYLRFYKMDLRFILGSFLAYKKGLVEPPF